MLQTCLDMRLCDFGTVPHLPKAERCLGGDGGGGDPLSTATRLNKARHRILCRGQETDSQDKESPRLTISLEKQSLNGSASVLLTLRGAQQRAERQLLIACYWATGSLESCICCALQRRGQEHISTKQSFLK